MARTRLAAENPETPRRRAWPLRVLGWMWTAVSFCSAVLGPLALTAVVLQFTPVPKNLLLKLAHPQTTKAYESVEASDGTPGAVVLFSGSGIPGESALIRTWVAADVARRFPEATVLLAVPSGGEPSPAVAAYIRELGVRGVDPLRIRLLGAGSDTYGQAAEVAGWCEALDPTAPLAVVTSPEHMFRAVACLRRHGLANPVWAVPTFSKSLDDPHPAPAVAVLDAATLEMAEKAPAAGAATEGDATPMVRNSVADRVRSNLRASALVLDEALSIAAYRARGWL